MKSSFELAMERMGGDDTPLSDQQKKQIAEIDSKFKAKVAERKIFLEKNISDLLQQEKHEEIDNLRKQVAEEIATLENKAEKEKEKIHEQK
jgi:hypothetical protein|tara:strand:+ start:156 stop:428 length:273 start_codon:yes stop_codon:yes gene_type:complete